MTPTVTAPRYTLDPVLTFDVIGKPVGQGRISFLGKGRPAVHTNQDLLLPWRQLVQHAATAAMRETWVQFPLEGPLGLGCYFTLAKPKSAPKRRVTYPDKRPDLSHLIRAVEDAMTNAGVWHDDAQLVQEHALKAFPGEDRLSLHVPGVRIVVHTLLTEVS